MFNVHVECVYMHVYIVVLCPGYRHSLHLGQHVREVLVQEEVANPKR